MSQAFITVPYPPTFVPGYQVDIFISHAATDAPSGDARQRLLDEQERLCKQWKQLSGRLDALETQRIHENRVEEKLRLDPLIAETRTERQKIEQQLADLEAQLSPDTWIPTFINDLQACVAQQLDSAVRWGWPAADISPPSPEQAALFLAILSPNYATTARCRQDWALFQPAADRQGTIRERVFLVQTTTLAEQVQPVAFANLRRFPFFQQDPDNGAVCTLDRDAGDGGRQLYFQRLDDLGKQLIAALHRLREPVAAADHRPAVLLAEVTPDLEELRDNIARHLQMSGRRVLPETAYPRAPDAFREAMQRDLADSLLFVQLLGPYTTPGTPDLPQGYERLQLELAKAADRAVLRWHDPALDRQRVRQPERLTWETVTVMPFEDFKQEVEQQVQRLIAQRHRPAVVGDAFALIGARSLDRQVAADLCEVLERHAIGYDLVDENDDLVLLAQQGGATYQALLVVYGQCEQQWVQQQVRGCFLKLGKQATVPVCAVYLGLPPGKEPLRIRPPHFHFFSDPADPDFQRFIAEVRAKVAAS
jgi:hypothetical protein